MLWDKNRIHFILVQLPAFVMQMTSLPVEFHLRLCNPHQCVNLVCVYVCVWVQSNTIVFSEQEMTSVVNNLFLNH